MGDDCGASSPVIPHPPFHLHHIHLTTTASLGIFLPPLWLWLQAALKKKLKKIQKKILLYSMYNKMYKKIFFFVWKKNSIVFSDFSAFKIKVTALSNFIFFIVFLKFLML
jgi:hypothetical protein